MTKHRLSYSRSWYISCSSRGTGVNISFSTHQDPTKSKSKVLFMGVNHDQRTPKPKALELSGRKLPWVERANHLGHTLTSNGKMDQDVEEKLTQFIDSSSKIRENFGNIDSLLKYANLRLLYDVCYTTQLYGYD